MRVNVDSSLWGDVRLKMLARALSIPANHALGCLTSVWHAAYARRTDVLGELEVNAQAELDAFAQALVRSELADDLGNGKVRLRGVKQRITYLLEQSKRARKGNEKRWGNRGDSTRRQRDRVGDPSATSDPIASSTLLFSGSSPDQLFSGSTQKASPAARPPVPVAGPPSSATKRRVDPPSADAVAVSAYLLEAIRSHKPDFSQSPTTWPKQADALLKRAGIDVARLKAAIDYAHRDQRGAFWRPNVQSVKKLGDRLDVIESQMRSGRTTNVAKGWAAPAEPAAFAGGVVKL